MMMMMMIIIIIIVVVILLLLCKFFFILITDIFWSSKLSFFADQNIEDGNLESFDSCYQQNTNDPDETSGPTGNLSTVATIEGHDQTSKL